MELPFSKFQAAGNDFIMISGNVVEHLNPEQCHQLCDRKFGIGADGVIIVKESDTSDFEVIYYNPDGSQSLCGNGSRAAVKFAVDLGLIKESQMAFDAYDGVHNAEILGTGLVSLEMADVQNVRDLEDGMFIDTGSPHLVRFVPDLKSVDVFNSGRDLRHNTPIEGGVNVNFVELMRDNTLHVRTYERGVENETLSCGTGVTAAALAASGKGITSPVKIITAGGNLEVSFNRNSWNHFSSIFLTGPAQRVFSGSIILKDN